MEKEIIKLEIAENSIHKNLMVVADFIKDRNFASLTVSCQVGVILQDCAEFESMKIADITKTPSVETYPAGRMYDTVIFVDPFMRWDDFRMISENEIIELSFNAEMI